MLLGARKVVAKRRAMPKVSLNSEDSARRSNLYTLG